ncbi:MAG: DUF438 domain-containing protein [Tissierellia bacterium]|nr:DUF438 domain-containing protein [Tissierellia bacterium]
MKNYINIDEKKLKEAFSIKKAYAMGEISLDMANAQMKAHIGNITPAELAYIEQTYEEKVDDECIKENIEEMLAIYEGVLNNDSEKTILKGHPIQNYIDENNAIRNVIKNIENLLQNKYIKNVWDEQFEYLNLWKIHLSRKQNQLYSILERKGFDRPTTTMWLYDNEVRDRITELIEYVKSEFDLKSLEEKFYEFKEYILDLMEKEETILYPTSLEMISEKEFAEMAIGDIEIGYCLISSPKFEHVETISESENENSRNGSFKDELSKLLSKYNIGSWTEDTPMNVKQGIMSLNQINLLFQHLPVDISYVDEKDIVAFYSDTKHRVFPRSKGVIGRKVQNCHPSSSVHMVEEIINKFRSGEKDKAEFWINKPGIFIYILYVAVRDSNGFFRGVMEMMQDCSHIRSLEGSRTLLDWGINSSEKDNIQTEKNEESTTTEKITKLTPDMKLDVILNQYPTLKDYMISKSDKFSMMNSPMFKIMKKIATVKMISEKTGISFEKLQEEFTKYINML